TGNGRKRNHNTKRNDHGKLQKRERENPKPRAYYNSNATKLKAQKNAETQQRNGTQTKRRRTPESPTKTQKQTFTHLFNALLLESSAGLTFRKNVPLEVCQCDEMH
ncbi:MAG: hypothetical protein WCJ11_12715, partial [Methylococcaceae bacterium]